MSTPFTSAANTGATEMELILSIVQEELVRAGKLLPTVKDYSSYAEPGLKSIEIPRFDSHFNNPAAQNPNGTTQTAFQTIDFANDVLNLDKWVTLPYALPDRVVTQSRIRVVSELAASAGKTFARYMDDEIIVRLKAAADGAGGLPNHVISVTGSNDSIAIADIAQARMLLNKANVSENDRFLIVSPEREKEMLALENFIRADAYGAREALLDGEIGRVFGFRVMAHNGLAAEDAVAYHKDAVGYAIQRGMKYETRRRDLRLQSDEVAFSMGWGTVLLEQGVKQVLLQNPSGGEG